MLGFHNTLPDAEKNVEGRHERHAEPDIEGHLKAEVCLLRETLDLKEKILVSTGNKT